VQKPALSCSLNLTEKRENVFDRAMLEIAMAASAGLALCDGGRDNFCKKGAGELDAVFDFMSTNLAFCTHKFLLYLKSLGVSIPEDMLSFPNSQFA
jgi:hypothetical protein